MSRSRNWAYMRLKRGFDVLLCMKHDKNVTNVFLSSYASRATSFSPDTVTVTICVFQLQGKISHLT